MSKELKDRVVKAVSKKATISPEEVQKRHDEAMAALKEAIKKPLRYTVTAEATDPRVKMILTCRGKRYTQLFSNIDAARKTFKETVDKHTGLQQYVTKAGYTIILADVVFKKNKAPQKSQPKVEKLQQATLF